MASRLTRGLAAIACTALLAAGLPGRSTAQARPGEVAAASRAGAARWSPADALTLPAALGVALTTHPDLRVAGANLAVAHADSAFARVPA